MRAHGVDVCADPVKGLQKARHRAENWHQLWHHPQMSISASKVRTLQDGLGRDHVGLFFSDDLSPDYTATVSRLLRFLDLPYEPAEGKNVQRVNVLGTSRLTLLSKPIVAATHDEVVRRAVMNSMKSSFRDRIPHSSLQCSTVPPAVDGTLRNAHDEDLAELSTLIADDVPPWLSEARLSEGPR
jgi:hypothetical protein